MAPDGTQRMVGRRGLLAILVAAPTLTVAVRLGMGAEAAPAPATIPSLPDLSDFADLGDLLTTVALPTSRLLTLEITTDNRVVLQLPRAEVGQGISTAVAMMVADELDARLADVDTPLSDARPELLFNQLTGGSNAVRSLYAPVRAVAAQARARLVTAAAKRWNVRPDTLTTRDTKVVVSDGRSASYGSLSGGRPAPRTRPAGHPSRFRCG